MAQICLAEYGEEHESTIIALNNSGSFFMFAGEPQKALAAYERSLKILQKGFGKEHKALAKSYHGVAIAQPALGRYDEAIAISAWQSDVMSLAARRCKKI